MWKISLLVVAFVAITAGSKQLVSGLSFSSGFLTNVRSFRVEGGHYIEDKMPVKVPVKVQKRSVFLYTRECEDEDLHKTFKAGHVWKSRCIVWTCAVTPGGAFNIPVKLECENLKVGKDGKEGRQCVPVGTTNLKIKRNGHLYKNCDCVWMFNQLQYHCPVEREHLEGKAAPGGAAPEKKAIKKVDMKKQMSVSKELDALKAGPKLVAKKANSADERKEEKEDKGEKAKEGKKPELKLPLPAPDKKTKKEH